MYNDNDTAFETDWDVYCNYREQEFDVVSNIAAHLLATDIITITACAIAIFFNTLTIIVMTKFCKELSCHLQLVLNQTCIDLTFALIYLGWHLFYNNTDHPCLPYVLTVMLYGAIMLSVMNLTLITWDHFVAVLGIRDGMVELHDPQFYPYAVLPLEGLLEACSC